MHNDDGHVLPSVLIIALLVTILLLSVLGGIFIYNYYIIKAINKTKLELACFSALQRTMASNKNLSAYSDEIKIDSVKIKIRSKLYGLYPKVNITSYGYGDSTKLIYTLGKKSNDKFNNAVIIAKEKLRASIAGNTEIEGNLLVTSEKIQRGRILGISGSARNYLDGKLIVNENIPIKYFNEKLLTNQFETNLEFDESKVLDGNLNLNNNNLKDFIELDSLMVLGDLYITSLLSNKNYNNDLKIIVKGFIKIDKKTSSDIKLHLISDSTISIGSNSNLKNIFFVSNSKIEIQENCDMEDVQLFAKRNITITKSQFSYPSTIVCFSDVSKGKNLGNSIEVNNSIVNGSILMINTSVGLSNNKNRIYIDDKSVVHGLVYSENNLTSRGVIKGIIYTYGFWFYKEPTEYINWLVDVKVNREELDPSFLFPNGFEDESKYKILKKEWIK